MDKIKKFTKVEITKNLRVTSKGEIHKKDIAKIQELKACIIPNDKIRFHYWSGTRRHLNVKEIFDISMLSNFCEFEKGNDGKGGVDSDYIIVTKKEFNKFKKRLSYFL